MTSNKTTLSTGFPQQIPEKLERAVLLVGKCAALKAAIIVSAVLIVAGPASATLFTTNAFSDTRINPRNPTSNYGTTDNFYVGNSSPLPDLDRGLFQYSLGAIPAAGDGTLFIQTFVNFGFDGHSLDAYLMSAANSGWLETEATWDNKNQGSTTPWDGGSHDNGSTFLGNSGIWTTGDASSTITIPQATINDAIANNGGILNLLLKSDSAEALPAEENIVNIHLREIDDGTDPQLSFEIVPEPGSIVLLTLAMGGLLLRLRSR